MNEQATRVSSEEQQKLKVLVGNFKKLDESRKDYIRELTRKLAEIHYSGEFLGKDQGGEMGLRNGVAGGYLG